MCGLMAKISGEKMFTTMFKITSSEETNKIGM
jgi:hypothetical protein